MARPMSNAPDTGFRSRLATYKTPESGIRRGDVNAMAEFFTRHRRRFAQIVRFRMDPRLSARIDVEDILQEAFLAATGRIRHFRDDRAISPFVRLREIVVQTLVDVHRRHLGAKARDCRRELAAPGSGDDTAMPLPLLLPGGLTSPSAAAIRCEQATQISYALQKMETIDREVLMMRHFEDLSNSEIAGILGIRISAASRRYLRAIERLGNILQQPN